ncbi:MAG: hypothetical protein K6F26_03400 [Lachnospiraceae bacterium]|nr:hypothetical protein [Lachnospiraceae bacterium]
MKKMNCKKVKAMKVLKNEVMYIGAFVEGKLPKTERIIQEELPNKNPQGENHITLFYLGDYPIIEGALFDDIWNLPEKFTVYVDRYGYNGINQGISVVSEEYDFQNIHLYGNRKTIPHITYSWDENLGGSPKGTGVLVFSEIPELCGKPIYVRVKAALFSGEKIPIRDYREKLFQE